MRNSRSLVKQVTQPVPSVEILDDGVGRLLSTGLGQSKATQLLSDT